MLGKGLESLIPKKHNQSDSDNAVNAGNFNATGELNKDLNQAGDSLKKESKNISGPVFQIEIEKVVLNPYQPRRDFDQDALNELATSIREFGILQPLVVMKAEEERENGIKILYQLIAGHRRLMAAKLLGFETVPAVIRNPLKKTEALEMAIVENVQRENLNPIETARAYSRLSDEFGFTQREISQRLGKSRESIANILRLLSLPTEIQEAVSSGKLNESQARLLLSIDDQALQIDLFSQILRDNLSVRDLKKRIFEKSEKPQGEVIETVKVEDLQLKSLEKELSEFLGAPVQVEFSRNGGKIVIHFYSVDEAMGITQKMKQDISD